MLNRLKSWLGSLPRDKRWRTNAGIGIMLWAVNFWLLYHLVSQKGYDSFWTNVALGAIWAVVWYPINRYGLWRSLDTQVTSSAGRSLAWWLVFFSLHQAAYFCAISTLDLPLVGVKVFLAVFGVVEFFANYWFKDHMVFVPKFARKTVAA